ncbi:PTS fructose transporter subunit IIA [[Actinobacillus] muris]|uniref:PTS fructose transporter subunit IIA n=1 Tax=Muribacter muris TaxID=67855 RepID=A0A0J5P815_9PAST|nr:fused PTS fructose transporter subunit IIA/HPr protein [Muribacter muris]KMK51639.1 PTS fructose transporter subunit IIA [[Actinobacillus] muris] [Muribacter muris]
MLNLSANNICLNSSAQTKEDAIRLVAQGLIANGNVNEGYQNGMFAREAQTSTFLGNGIAIPHGTLDTRELVQQTGVQVYQFPQGVEWGEGNIAYVVIGIAAKSDEHLTILRQLTSVLGDEAAAEKLAQTQSIEEFIAIFQGQSTLPVLSETLVSLNLDSNSLLALTAVNATNLQEKGYVNQQFISDILNDEPTALGDNLFVNDCAGGNLHNGIAIARNQQGKTLLTIAMKDDSLQPILSCLLSVEVRQQLTRLSAAEMVACLSGKAVQAVGSAQDLANTAPQPTACEQDKAIGTFTVRNEHGLHARPCAVLVQTLKPFEAKVSVENLDRQSAPVNAKSTMRVVALGATKGQRLRFVAEGQDAQAALQALQQAFINGLGESVSFVPSVEDSIEVVGQTAMQADGLKANIANESIASNEQEATFTVKNEHGLHARPSAVLVNEVKKYKATVQVQNVDRQSPLVSAKSLMKIVALGVQKGHRLRFVASGEDAEQALAGIGEAIANGLGE